MPLCISPVTTPHTARNATEDTEEEKRGRERKKGILKI